jgi:hypothetical protein
MPVDFWDFNVNYAFNLNYWYTHITTFVQSGAIPILAFKLGRMQWGWKGGLACMLGSYTLRNQTGKVIDFVRDGLNWFKTGILQFAPW